MMSESRLVPFNSSLIIPRSSFFLPVYAVEGDVDAAAFAVVVRDEEVPDEPQSEFADVVFERERVAGRRGRRVDLADVHVVADAVPSGRAFDPQRARLRVAAYRQAILVQNPLAEPARRGRVRVPFGEFELVCAEPADGLVAARGLEPSADVLAERARDDE